MEPVELFFSYSHKDEKLRDKLEPHLAMLKRDKVIKSWHDRKISAGTEWAKAIDDHLNSADIILLLISADFLASDYCYDIELARAMERHEAGEARVIPIILKAVDNWYGAPFGKLQAFPKDAKPVTQWKPQNDAFVNIAQGIRQAALEMAEILASRRSIPLQTPIAESPLMPKIVAADGSEGGRAS
jgi:TIR domain